MGKNLLLLFDFCSGGFGDVTNLLRLGRFLESKGHKVHSTLIIQKFKGEAEVYHRILGSARGIESIIYPQDIPELKKYYKSLLNEFRKRIFKPKRKLLIRLKMNLLKKTEEEVDPFLITLKKEGANILMPPKNTGVSEELLALIKTDKTDMKTLMMVVEHVIDYLNHQKKTHIDYELVCFDSKKKRAINQCKRIIIDQYSGSGSGFRFYNTKPDDIYIAPIPPQESNSVINAGFLTHHSYHTIPKKSLIELLITQGIPANMSDQLENSSWGIYYSGTLGTDGLFFELMNPCLSGMKNKNHQVTYFSFIDWIHFNKYVIPYLGDNWNVINLSGPKKFPKKLMSGKPILINMQAKSEIMEAIINSATLCSVCAGDGSFNILYNRLFNSSQFVFFKYFNLNQSYFFRFLVDKMFEFESRQGMDHDCSYCLFLFGFYERLMRNSLKEKNVMLDEFQVMENKKVGSLKKFFSLNSKAEDYALMRRMFIDPIFISRYNLILKSLPEFIRQENNLEPVEDILLSILEK